MGRLANRRRFRALRPRSWRHTAVAWGLPVVCSLIALLLVHARAAADTAPSATELAQYLQSNQLNVGILPIDNYDQIYYLYNRHQVQLTTAGYNHLEVMSDGPYVVWQGMFNGQGQIFLYNVLTGAETQITASGTSQAPFLHGDQVVWQTWDGQHWQVMYFDGTQVYQITNDNYSASSPLTDGKQIIYAEQIGVNDWKAFSFDIASGQTTLIREGTTISTAYPHFNADGSISTEYVPS